MIGAAACRSALQDPIVHGENTNLQTETSLERGHVTIIVAVRILHERGASVDRDHDHLLRAFMKARDE
jgi:hypothetical protein